jgi:hypothetical protein
MNARFSLPLGATGLGCVLLFMAGARAIEAYPVPRSGFCPNGYHASGTYCVPNNSRSGAAIERDGFCPQGYYASGDYCVVNNTSSGKAIPRDGFCPQGYHASGNYCVEN